MKTGSGVRWWARYGACLRTAVLAAAVLCSPGAAQDHRWAVELAGTLDRHLTHSGGPALGAPGIELQVFRVSGTSWDWGGSLAYHRLGRFPNPVPGDYRDESATAAGVRLRRGGGGGLSSFGYVKVGLDVYAVADRPATGDVGRDPGVGGYFGLGRLTGGTGSAVKVLAELGVHGVLATGELTGGGGWYMTAMLGLSF